MVFILFPVIVYAFLLLGSLVFLVCALVPPMRRYALSAALWCAMWGPGTIGFILLAAVLAELGFLAHDFLIAHGNSPAFLSMRPWAALAKGYLVFAGLMTAVVATGTAWVHQKLTRRFTFALFRLYVASVCAGIGSVFGILLGFLIAWRTHWMLDVLSSYLVWGASTLGLMAVFAVAAYKNASHLRGPVPTTFTWITPEEFSGTKVKADSLRE